MLCGALGFVLLLSPERGAFDFQAFYCAGRAVRAHADPYRTQPLEACERAQTRGTYARLPRGIAVPAPLPGYDLFFFALLAALPFALAKALWGAMLAAAGVLAVWAVMRVARADPLTVCGAFAASLFMPSLAFGEPFPLFALAFGGCAWFLQRGEWAAAGLSAAASLVEPNLGLPLCLGVAFAAPRARAALTLGIGALAALSLASVGSAVNAEYLGTILHLQALSDISSDAQLGMAAMLHAFGAPANTAIAAGAVAYAALAIGGASAGVHLARRFGEPAFAAVTPVAFALAASSYVHAGAFFAALPLALLLLRHRRNAGLALSAAAVLLAVPWIDAVQAGSGSATVALGALVTFVLLVALRVRTAFAILGGLAAAALLFFAPAWYEREAQRAHPPFVLERIDSKYPQEAWQRYDAQNLSNGGAAAWVLRGASWAGVGLLVFVTLSTGRRSRQRIPDPALR